MGGRRRRSAGVQSPRSRRRRRRRAGRRDRRPHRFRRASTTSVGRPVGLGVAALLPPLRTTRWRRRYRWRAVAIWDLGCSCTRSPDSASGGDKIPDMLRIWDPRAAWEPRHADPRPRGEISRRRSRINEVPWEPHPHRRRAASRCGGSSAPAFTLVERARRTSLADVTPRRTSSDGRPQHLAEHRRRRLQHLPEPTPASARPACERSTRRPAAATTSRCSTSRPTSVRPVAGASAAPKAIEGVHQRLRRSAATSAARGVRCRRAHSTGCCEAVHRRRRLGARSPTPSRSRSAKNATSAARTA